ncbi:MAG: hypothetical protein A2V79_09245 [Betaproteobacteria bacterium RBG_16_56_24]|nr:MAG: hypothetical protein A2V79_09245 [Betaproteobacteria bacterium RBG_16_56_24]
MSEYTQEQLDLLSDEERAAIAEPQDDPEALLRTAGDDADDADDTDAGAGDVKPVVDKALADSSAESKPSLSEFEHQYQVAPIEDYDGKVAALAVQKSELRTKFKEGDLDIDEYEAQKDVLVAQEQQLREQKLKVEIASEQNAQTAKARWDWEQDRFFSDEKNTLYKDKYLLAAFDAAVRDLGADAANADKKGAWFLQEADKIVRSRFTGKPAEQPKDERKPDGSRKPDLSLVPKSLGGLPAAELPDTGGVDEFAHIDRLDGVDYENAVAALSPVERERFRRSA